MACGILALNCESYLVLKLTLDSRVLTLVLVSRVQASALKGSGLGLGLSLEGPGLGLVLAFRFRPWLQHYQEIVLRWPGGAYIIRQPVASQPRVCISYSIVTQSLQVRIVLLTHCVTETSVAIPLTDVNRGKLIKSAARICWINLLSLLRRNRSRSKWIDELLNSGGILLNVYSLKYQKMP